MNSRMLRIPSGSGKLQKKKRQNQQRHVGCVLGTSAIWTKMHEKDKPGDQAGQRVL